VYQPPSSPIVTTHNQPSREFSNAGEGLRGTPNLLRRRTEPITSTPTEQGTSLSDLSPRRIVVPLCLIEPVPEEALSTLEDDVFDGKAEEASGNMEQDEKQEGIKQCLKSTILTFLFNFCQHCH